MSGQQKRGFRLPWAADRAPEEGAAGAATLEPAGTDPTNGVASDDLGDGPFRLAVASPELTTDPAPAEFDVPEVDAEAAMIEAQTTQSPDATRCTGTSAAPPGTTGALPRTRPHHDDPEHPVPE